MTEHKSEAERLAYLPLLLENLDDGVIVTDADYVITAWNHGAEAIYGWMADEVVGRSIVDIWRADVTDDEQAEALHQLTREGRWRGELVAYRKNGTPIWVDQVVVVIPGDGNGPAGYLGIHHEATARKELEGEQQQLADIVQHSPDFIGICDLDWRPTFINKVGQQLVGLCGMDQVRRTTVLDFFMPEDRAFVRDELFPLLLEKGTWPGERDLRFRHFQTGAPILVSWNAFRIDDHQTRGPIGYATVTRDIRERKQAEESLRETKRQLESTLESITDAFSIVDHDWRFVYVNPAAERLGRKRREDLIGRNIWDEYPESASTGLKFYDAYHRAMDERVTVKFEEHYPPFDVWQDVMVYPSEEGITIYGRDVTQRKRAEHELATRTQQQVAVADLSLRALMRGSLQNLMDDATALVATTLGVVLCQVLELVSGDRLLSRATAGAGRNAGELQRAAYSQAEYTLRVGGPVVVNDFGGETRFTPALSDSTVGGVSVVIPGMEGPFGVLAVVSRDGQAFSKDALDFMQLVGNVLAARVQREASESKVSEVAQSERTRMARDLHDEAAQDLNYALWKARGMLATSTEPDQGSALDQLILALDRAQQQVRRAIYDLRLPEEEEGPLLGPMKSLIALHRRMAPGRDIRLEVLHDAILSRPFGAAGTELLRIVSEALTNARMHSQSGSIVVRVAPSARGLRAEVADDGRGFDPAQEPLAPGLGIKGMVDRARVLDAELTIRSAPGGGTRVILDMPLKHRPDEP